MQSSAPVLDKGIVYLMIALVCVFICVSYVVDLIICCVTVSKDMIGSMPDG